MIFLCGDTHGNQAKIMHFTQQMRDYRCNSKFLISCGDFGFVLRDNEVEHRFLDDMSKQREMFLFVDGNHENFDYLESLPIRSWNGGRVQFLRPNVIHLMRGETYMLEGKRFFVFGGAVSPDKEFRKKAEEKLGAPLWWKEELPSDEECINGLKNLQKANLDVDYILTHTAPAEAARMMALPIHEEETSLANFLGDLSKKVSYRHWFFGHHHRDMSQGRFTCIYNQLVEIR